MDQPTGSTEQRPLAVLGWAAFLACSWTWCIGMFLPVILLRDYGTAAWVVFAVPNVVGAAAMGWVLQRPGQSEMMVRRHAPAMVAFSAVTILFHVLLADWVVRWLGNTAYAAGYGGWTAGSLLAAAAAGAAVVGLPLLVKRPVALTLSALVWAGSLAAFVVTVMHTPTLPVPAGRASAELAFLAPTCLVGFALCPYADLTFHRARQALSTYGAVAAFTLGFGALFLVMIVFTLWYGPMTIPPDARRGLNVQPITRIAAAAVAWHMVAQSGFTVAAHALEIGRRLRTPAVAAAGADVAAPLPGDRRANAWGLVVGGLYGAAVLVSMWVLLSRGFSYAGQGPRELAYRLFLAFYALVTPAYVLAVLMRWPGGAATTGQRWAGFAVAVILAGPAFWMGFIEQKMPWLAAGVVVLLLVRPVVEQLAKARRPAMVAETSG